jgi:hypothetical protein
MTRSGVKEDHTASYFSHDNAEATRLREQLAHDSLEMLIQWLKDGGNVGIHGMGSMVALLPVLHESQMPRIAPEHGGLSHPKLFTWTR